MSSLPTVFLRLCSKNPPESCSTEPRPSYNGIHLKLMFSLSFALPLSLLVSYVVRLTFCSDPEDPTQWQPSY